MAEIDDNTYNQLANLDAFVRRGLADPKTRRKMLEIQKHLNPNVAIPELDESDPIRSELAELKAEIKKKEDERAEQEMLGGLRTKWNAGQAFARKKGYSDEGIEKLEKFMQDENIGSHEAAIPYYEQRNPPPVPATSSSTRWDFFAEQQGDPQLDLKLLYEGKDEQFLDRAIADTLNKVRSGEITR